MLCAIKTSKEGTPSLKGNMKLGQAENGPHKFPALLSRLFTKLLAGSNFPFGLCFLGFSQLKL